MKYKTQEILILILIAVITLGFGFGCYYIGKKISYEWWYKDMVRETVKGMVKPEYLKD